MQPEVLAGMRAPRAVRLEEAETRAANRTPGFTMPVAPEGTTVYISKFARYRVQITAPLTGINPATGQPIVNGREFAAQFEEGRFVNDERDPEFRALIDKTLQSNRYFGPFGSLAHFWLAEDQRAKVDAGRLKAAVATIKSLPQEALAQVMSELKQGEATDHAMPQAAVPAPEQSSRRPIPNR